MAAYDEIALILNDMTETQLREELTRIAALPPEVMTQRIAMVAGSIRNALAIIAKARTVEIAPEGN